jgi:RimJ/RimL family protein N-acetyltransferase
MLLLCKFDEYFLEMTWNWLNDPEIKELTNSSEFTIDDQKKWFTNLKNRKDYLIWGLTLNGKPIGACGLKNITQNDCEYWGYIGEKEYWGKGLGSKILIYMEVEANKLNLESIWLQVIKSNERAIRLYIKHGYTLMKEKEGIFYLQKNIC